MVLAYEFVTNLEALSAARLLHFWSSANSLSKREKRSKEKEKSAMHATRSIVRRRRGSDYRGVKKRR